MKKYKLNKDGQSSYSSQPFLESLSFQQQETLTGGTSDANNSSDLVCIDCEAVATGHTVRIPVQIKYEA